MSHTCSYSGYIHVPHHIGSKPGPHTTTQTELQPNHGPNIGDKSTNNEYFAVELKQCLQFQYTLAWFGCRERSRAKIYENTH